MITLDIEYAVTSNRRVVLQLPGNSVDENLDFDLLIESIKEKEADDEFDSLDQISYQVLHIEEEADDWKTKSSNEYREEYSMMTNDDFYQLLSCGGVNAAEFVALPLDD